MKFCNTVVYTTFVVVAMIAPTCYGQRSTKNRALVVDQTRRRTEIKRIVGYTPVNDISDLATLDLDVQKMEERVLSRELNHAKRMYMEGGHVQSYATLTLINPEGDGNYPAGSKVWGYNDVGQQITGKTMEDVSWTSNSRFLQEVFTAASGNSTHSNKTHSSNSTTTGGSGNSTTTGTNATHSGSHNRTSSSGSHNSTNSTGSSSAGSSGTVTKSYYKGNITLQVLYDTDGVYPPSHCMVGALHVIGGGHLTKCFTRQSTIKIASKGSARNMSSAYNYTYNIHLDNKSGRSLQTIAKEANSFRGVNDYDLFAQYYGDYDYADRWVMAAADGGATNFKSGLGNADFALLEGRLGRGEGILKGAVFLNLYMYIIAKLELAVKACRVHEHKVSLEHLDDAVALFAGSLSSGSEDGETGVFLYGLANSRALEFKTAGHLGDHDVGTAYVNVRIIDELKQMQLIYKSLNMTRCEESAQRTQHVANLMKIPIVQSVLIYAYMRERGEHTDEENMEKAEGKGATYLAAVLPYIHKCSSKDAAVLYEQMRVGSRFEDVHFLTVKAALERTYNCLNITCADVGGIWEGTTYSKDATPCGMSSEGKKSSSMNGGGIFGLLAATVICAFLYVRYRKRNFFSIFSRRKKSVEEMSVGTIAAVSEIS